MESRAAIEASLAQCTGSENYHYNSICRNSGIVYTEGIRQLAMMSDSWWLIDAIASHQPQCRRDPQLSQIQFWSLNVNDGAGVLNCERDEGDLAFKQDIPMTDFPLPEIKIWLESGMTIIDGKERQVMVAYLPSER